MKLDEKQAVCATNLLQNADYRQILGWLGAEAEQANQKLIYTSEDAAMWQGRTQALTEVITALAQAKQTLERYQLPKT
jgi:hypothetical protein